MLKSLSFVVALGCVALCYSAHVVDHQTLAHAVDAAFVKLDNNTDGLMEETEFKDAFGRLDTNGDSQISLEEFRAQTAAGQYTDALFHFYDPDGNGMVDQATLHNIWLQIDHNHSGDVNRTEFDHFYTKLLEEIINHHGHHITG